MNLWFDLKYAWRLLRKSPGHSLLCIGVVGLSVGLTLTVYSFVYTMGFKSLAFPNSARWYTLQMADSATARHSASSVDAYTYQQIVKRSRTIQHLGVIDFYAPGVLSEGQASANLPTGAISPELLRVTRVTPFLGRLFDAGDGQPDSAASAILSYEVWQNYFASDPAVVGKETRINAMPAQIIGVLPKGFNLIYPNGIWLPLTDNALSQPSNAGKKLQPLIELGNAQSPESVLNELNAIVSDINLDFPDRYKKDRRIVLVPAHRMYTDNALAGLWMMVLIAAFVALLGCVNIGTVFFARMLERSRELAIRQALGSSRWRLIRQSLAESSLIALLGMLLGLALGALGIGLLQKMLDFAAIANGGDAPFDFSLGARDIVFAAMAAIVIWLLSSLVPAIRVSNQETTTVLAASGKGAGNQRSARATHTLVGFQVVISCYLLVVSGAFVLAFNELTSKSSGVDAENVMVSVGRIQFNQRYAKQPDRLRYIDELAAAIRAKTPSADVAFTTGLPSSSPIYPMLLDTLDPDSKQGPLLLPLAYTSENYFQTLGIALRSGRLFESTDNDASLEVALLDENLAERFWPHQNPLGKRIQLNPSDNGPWLTVIGVVAHVRGPAADARSGADGPVYRPLRQRTPESIHLVVKLPSYTVESRRTLAAAAFAVDRDLPVSNLQRLDEYLESRDIIVSFSSKMLLVITFITAFLAATGIFGVISRSVVQRTQEIGVRRALGASNRIIIAVFLRQSAIYLLIGVVIGGGLGVLTVNGTATLYPNVMSYVLPVVLGVLVNLTLIVFIASYLPVRRAIALEPGDALRYE